MIWIIGAAVSFGFWQDNATAGVFMLCVLWCFADVIMSSKGYQKVNMFDLFFFVGMVIGVIILLIAVTKIASN